MIEPPPGLPWSAESLAAWRRIVNKLVARGLWEPMYSRSSRSFHSLHAKGLNAEQYAK